MTINEKQMVLQIKNELKGVYFQIDEWFEAHSEISRKTGYTSIGILQIKSLHLYKKESILSQQRVVLYEKCI